MNSYAAKAATCTTNGHSAYTKCTGCGLTTGYTEYKATGHVKGPAATCTTSQICNKCGKVLQAAYKHNYSPATCTKPKKCTRCGATTGSALGHTWVDATCTTAKHCTRCGETERAPYGHNPGPAATCTTPQTCKRCGKVLQAALGHESDGGATCTKASTCKKCGKVLQTRKEHVFKDATCTEPETCINCGIKQGSAAGHSWTANGCIQTCSKCKQQTGSHQLARVQGKEPTCESAGYSDYIKCKYCDYYSQPKTTIPAKGHNYTNLIGGTTAGCEYACTRCNSITNKAHEVETIPGKTPTCLQEGYSESTRCKKCKTVLKKAQVLSKKEHSYTVATGTADGASGCKWRCANCNATTTKSHKLYGVQGKAASCTADGWSSYTKCGYCSYCATEKKVIPATGHTKGPAATCTTAQKCTVCNAIITNATGHTKGPAATCITDQICTKCKVVIQARTGHDYSDTPTSYNKNVNGHTPIYKCTNCTSTKSDSQEAHTVNSYTDNGNGTHSGTCTVCSYTVTKAHEDSSGTCTVCGATTGTTCEHTWVTKSNSTDHWEECSLCNITKTGSVENHNVAAYRDNGDNTHSGTCTVCNYVINEYHNYGSNHTCTRCGATETTTCEHKWVMKSNSLEHWEECSECNITKEGSLENHNITTWTDNGDETHSGICTVCNSKATQTHNYTGGTCTECGAVSSADCEHNWVMKSDREEHWKECDKCHITQKDTVENHKITTWENNGDETHSGTCTVCNYKKTDTHNFKDGICTECKVDEDSACIHDWKFKSNPVEHWEECTKCYYTKDNSLESHIITKWEDKGNNTHSGICTKCNYVVTAKHDYENGICTKCGAKEGDQEVCKHDWVLKNNKDGHWQECNKCKLVQEETVEKHTITSYGDNGDGTHIGKCQICGYSVTNKHNFKNGTCTECGTIDSNYCDHIWGSNSNKDEHWQECKKCHLVQTGTTEAHNVKEWNDNGDGTHSGTCTVCGYKITENHSNGTSKNCDKCNYIVKEDDGNNSGNQDGNNNGNQGGNNNGNQGGNNNGNQSGNNNGNQTGNNNENQAGNNNANNTNSGKELPNTGKKTIIISVIGLTTLFGTSIVGIKKYKDIV